jgi:hypothetical protein
VLTVFVQPGAVDRVFRPGAGLSGAVARGDHTSDWVRQRLGGEAPDLALEDRVVRSGVDFIDAPVIGLAEREYTGRIVCGLGLTLAEEHAHRIGPARLVDVVEGRPQIDIVRRGEFPRLPAQDGVPWDIGGFVGRRGRKSQGT